MSTKVISERRFLMALFFLAIIVAGVIRMLNEPKREEAARLAQEKLNSVLSQKSNEHQAAFRTAKEAVRASLKLPSLAGFSKIDDRDSGVVAVENERVRAFGSVKGINKIGIEPNQPWQVILRSNQGTWAVESVSIGESGILFR